MCIRMSWVRCQSGVGLSMGCSIRARCLGQLAGGAAGGGGVICGVRCVSVVPVCAALRGVYSKQHNPPTSTPITTHVVCVCVAALRSINQRRVQCSCSHWVWCVWLVCRWVCADSPGSYTASQALPGAASAAPPSPATAANEWRGRRGTSSSLHLLASLPAYHRKGGGGEASRCRGQPKGYSPCHPHTHPGPPLACGGCSEAGLLLQQGVFIVPPGSAAGAAPAAAAAAAAAAGGGVAAGRRQLASCCDGYALFLWQALVAGVGWVAATSTNLPCSRRGGWPPALARPQPLPHHQHQLLPLLPLVLSNVLVCLDWRSVLPSGGLLMRSAHTAGVRY
jgi:hypothetical protein